MNNNEVIRESEGKTFEEMGIVFTAGSGCHTCRDNSCHNLVPLKKSGEEYSVHISTNNLRSEFLIHASKDFNVESDDDIREFFIEEKKAVKYICDTFEWFKCA